MRPRVLLPLIVTLAASTSLIACGGDDPSPATSSGSASSASTTASTETQAASTAAAQPSLEQVLRCLNSAAVDAKRQSGLDDTKLIGIDYSGGRTTINFEADAEAADLAARLAVDYGEVVRAGTIVASITPTGAQDKAAVEGCITPGAASTGETADATPAATDPADPATPAAATDDVASPPSVSGAVAADSPTAEEVRSCLKGAGVAVRDKANTEGKGVEIAHTDYTVTVIDFYASEAEAIAVEKVSKDFGKPIRAGTVVATLKPLAEKNAAAIGDCIAG